MNLKHRILKALFPPRNWYIKPPEGTFLYGAVYWLEGASRIGRRYNFGPFTDWNTALEACRNLNRGKYVAGEDVSVGPAYIGQDGKLYQSHG